jgi:hypothetical protein
MLVLGPVYRNKSLDMKTCPFCGGDAVQINVGPDTGKFTCPLGHTPALSLEVWNTRRTVPKPSIASRLRATNVSKRCRDCHPGTVTFIGDHCDACRETEALLKEAATALEKARAKGFHLEEY